jgi:hypothetical protein
MFGLFKKRNKLDDRWFVMGVQVAAIHERMRAETPGAAYIFANTLHSARALIDNDGLSIDQKIAEIRKELALSRAANTSNADCGTSILALQFVVELLEAMRLNDVGMMAMSAAFGEIAKNGTSYRNIGDRDEHPPVSNSAKEILAKSEGRCLAELVNRIHRDHENQGTDPRDVVWSITALFDIRDEIECGQLGSYLAKMRSAIVTQLDVG